MSGRAAKVRLHAQLPTAGAAVLVAGEDLLLADLPAAAAAPDATLLNDWLDGPSRTAAQADAERGMVSWRDRYDAALTHDDVCLPHVHTGELQADAFLASARVLAGICAFIESERPEVLELHGADPDLAVALGSVAAAAGVATRVATPGPPPTFPIGFQRSVRRGRLAAVREFIGAPALPRGRALIQPFRNTQGLWHQLPRHGIHPVLDPALLPPLSATELLAAVRHGGVVGHPGWRRRRRSSHALERALATARAGTAPSDPFELLTHRRATSLLTQLAGPTFALADTFRTAARRGLRTAIVPSDTGPYARTFSSATRSLGANLVRIQHGFYSDLWRVSGRLTSYVDGIEAEHVAVWSPRDAARLETTARGRIVVTGNPGATAVEPLANRGEKALVLLQSPSPSTLSLDVRAAWRFATSALTGLSQHRPGTPVMLRPHALDPINYRPLCQTGVEIRGGGPLDDLLRDAAICVGPLSTATLEAIVAGIPTVFLDLSTGGLPWPFDGSSLLPRATSAASLDAALGAVEPPTAELRDAALEALGARSDASERVVGLIAQAVGD